MKLSLRSTIAAAITLPALLCASTFAQSSAPAASAGYDQPYRPQVHFSPRKNWTNDPNGLVYFEGEYHLFFQYNPFGDQWGHMSWGHAVSTDLAHWHELPVAIPEDEHGMIFTGSVVVDRNNTSGFCASHHPCLVAVYTVNAQTPAGTRQTQNIAYSLDRGRTWKRYEKNPVLDLNMQDFRDPSVSWNEAAGKWIMAVALPNDHKVRFYASSNLKDWTLQSDFGPSGSTAGQWECPDLITIPAAKGQGSLWALKVGINPGAPQGGSGEQYFLGSFDGSHFTPLDQPGAHGWTNYGKDDYCAISYNGLPVADKPILLGWMDNWQYASKLPTSPWRGQMSLPRRLTYIRDNAGLALRQSPVTAPLRAGKPLPLSSKSTSLDLHTPYELELTFPQSATAPTGIRLRSGPDHWTEIGFDPARRIFYIDRTHSGLTISPDFPVRTETPIASARPFDLTLIVDRSSVEAYAQDGTIAMTSLIFPPTQAAKLEFFPASGKAITGKLWHLQSIWP
jgi:sucrose-6-phosphate hydrolase SacC (GH32 family)